MPLAPWLALLLAGSGDAAPRALTGAVVDAAGAPVSGAVVSVDEHDVEPVRTGRLGTFRLEEVPPGPVRVRASRAAGDVEAGFAAWSASGIAGPADASLRLVLGPAGAPVTGVAVDGAGRALPGIEVWAAPPEYPVPAFTVLRLNAGKRADADGLVAAAITDASGGFRLPRVAPASVLLAGLRHGALVRAGPAPASGPARVIVPVALRVRGTVVTKGGASLDGAFVAGGGAHLPSRFETWVDGEIAAAGWVGVGAVDHRTRWVRAAAAKDGFLDLGRVVLEPGDRDAATRHVRVRVEDERTHAVVREVTFGRAALGRPEFAWRRDDLDSGADARGWHLVPAGDGPEEVEILAEGRALARVRLDPGQAEVTVALAPEAALDVAFPPGAAPPFSRKLLLDGPEPVGASTFRLRGASPLELGRLPAGRYVVRVLPPPDLSSVGFGREDGPSYPAGAATVPAGGKVELVLGLPAPGAAATLRVAHARGVCMHLLRGPAPADEAGVRGLLGHVPARAGADDVFEAVPAGRYTLVAFGWRAGGLQIASAPVELGPGEARAVLELPAGAPLLPTDGPAIPAFARADGLGCGLDGPIGRPPPP